MKITKPFLVLSITFLACSSSERGGFETTSHDATEGAKPGAPSSGSDDKPGTDGGTSSSPAPADDCKKVEPNEACGLAPQCGCADGKTCDVIDGSGNAKCVSAGSAPMGHPCESSGDCSVGLTCVFGTCHAYCNNPGQACTQADTGPCVQVKNTDNADIPNLAVCRVNCAPHDPSACGGGNAVCIIDPDGNTECQTGGTKKEGEECSPADPCGPALACATADKKSACRRWCRLGEDDCGGDKTCVGFAPAIEVRGVAYGSCS